MRRKMYEQVYSLIKPGRELGLGSLVTGNNGFYPNNLFVNGKLLKNFSLLDYLDLSNDQRVKNGAIEAINKFGACTTISKIYMNLDIYVEAEELLSKIFNKPVLLFARTTLAHIGVMPILTDTNDAILLDHKVHTSVRLAADLLKSYGNHVETIKHNRMDILEDKIKQLQSKYDKVWYFADSIYSMYGDILPEGDLLNLLNCYDKFHLYVDDAHGMSWTGKNGKGYILENMPYHERMIVVTSLGKGFGAGGGVVICHDTKMKDFLSVCAAPLMFTSPVCPSTLGAIAASAKIHLTNEISQKQSALKAKIDLFNNTARGFDLPLLNSPNTPLIFLATGQIDMSHEICYEMMQKGYFLSVSQYPAVSVNNSGLRATSTLLHSNDDIVNLLKTLKEEYQKALDKRGITVYDILKHYKVEKTEKVTVA